MYEPGIFPGFQRSTAISRPVHHQCILQQKTRSGKVQVAEHTLAVPMAVTSSTLDKNPYVIPLSVLAKRQKPSKKK